MEVNGGIVPLGNDLAYLNGGRFGWNEGVYANQSTIQHGLNYNRQETENQADCTRSVINQGLDTLLGQFESAERARQFSHIGDNQFRMELRLADHAVATQQLINDNFRKCDQNFCDMKAEVLKLQSGHELLAVKIDNNAELAQKNAEIIALQAQLDNRNQTINNYCYPQPARCVDPCCCNGGGSDSSDVASAVVNALAPALNSIASAVAGISNCPGNSGNNGGGN